MPGLKPQTAFLLRGSALLITLLSVWWFVLLTPLLAALQIGGGIAGALVFGGRNGDLIQENPSGDWTFHVPIEMTIPPGPGNPVAQQIHSIDFDIPRVDAIAFTFSLPVFWAIVLAAPRLRQNVRPLVIGTAVMAVIELLLLLLFAEVYAQKSAAQLANGGQAATPAWILRFGEYLSVSVIPYAAPFFVAFAVHRDLRGMVFQTESTEKRAALHGQKQTTRASSRPRRA